VAATTIGCRKPEAADQLAQLAARLGVLEPVEAVEAARLAPNCGRGLGE
jgi:hypothetical protein